MNQSKPKLVRDYGLPGATAVLVIRTIEEEKLSDIDKSTIAQYWILKYQELSSKNTEPELKCDFKSFVELILHGHIKFNHEISFKEADNYGKNYNYVRIAINILKRDYGHKWPKTLRVPELWKKVFIELNRDSISYSSQLHVLKALVENGMVDLVGGGKQIKG